MREALFLPVAIFVNKCVKGPRVVGVGEMGKFVADYKVAEVWGKEERES